VEPSTGEVDAEHPEEAAAIGARARADIARELSPRATGAAMRRRLEKLAA
jgi:hypothetical protein